MAKTMVTNITVSRGGTSIFALAGATRNTTNDSFACSQITVNTSETTYTIPTDVGNAMEVGIRNMSAANFVDVGFATGSYFIRLRPTTNTNTGSAAYFPVIPTQGSIFMLANTAACEVEIFVQEE